MNVFPTTPPIEKSAGSSLVRWILSTSSTALVWISLGGFAWWGHLTDWKFSQASSNRSMIADLSDWCGDHGVPQSICVNCQNPREPVVQFANGEAFEKSGIEIDVVAQQEVTESLLVPGEVSFDPSRTAHLTSRVSGTIWRVRKHLGDRVEAGDVLLLVDAHDVGKAKSEFVQAISSVRLKQGLVDRLAPLAETGAAPARQIIEAEAALRAAELRQLAAQETLSNLGFRIRGEQFAQNPVNDVLKELKFLGIPTGEVTDIDQETASSNLIPVRSPIAGIVVAADAVVGEVVGPTSPLFTVADRNRLWVTLEVPQKEIRKIQMGQKIRFRPDGVEKELKGEVQWIADTVDERTRTLRVRAEVENSSLQIKAGAFGTGQIVLRETADAIVVPQSAIHGRGDSQFVFVRNPDFLKAGGVKTFAVRAIQTGGSTADGVQVVKGLSIDEVIATAGSELLRSRLSQQQLKRRAKPLSPSS